MNVQERRQEIAEHCLPLYKMAEELPSVVGPLKQEIEQ